MKLKKKKRENVSRSSVKKTPTLVLVLKVSACRSVQLPFEIP